ncbi:hypothetical protein PoB_001017000 [Plakobranchus ocellatus]|uniref:Uncharacterized protein n=1 Tax=Plakobranchus ocellatus TaxID=259542 RepID=A0AAV3YMD9_9GAST|nr:hypothetical protein PoB_001017000 [Plakobranchus ocellatus]
MILGFRALLQTRAPVAGFKPATERSLQSRFRVDRVNPAAARQTLKHFWRPPGRLHSAFGGRYRDSRVLLAAAILTLESFWGRVILACYIGVLV